jgi:hypothetical protein
MAVESGVTPWQPKVLVTVPGGVQCPTEPLARDPRALSESAEAGLRRARRRGSRRKRGSPLLGLRSSAGSNACS